jgi:glycine cleavage system H protein
MALEDLKFHEAHTWVRQEGDELIIGITDFAQEQLGDLVFIELPEVGARLEADEPFGSIESPKAVEDLIAPVNGEVTRRNDEVVDNPEIVNEDPYGEGWLVGIKAEEGAELDQLMGRDEYLDTVGADEDDEDNLLDDDD